MKFQSSIGFILLSIYLILIGIASLFGIAIPGIVMALLALVSGILILISK